MGISVSRVTVAVHYLSLGDSLDFVLPLGVTFLSLPLGEPIVSFSLMEISKNTTRYTCRPRAENNLRVGRNCDGALTNDTCQF